MRLPAALLWILPQRQLLSQLRAELRLAVRLFLRPVLRSGLRALLRLRQPCLWQSWLRFLRAGLRVRWRAGSLWHRWRLPDAHV